MGETSEGLNTESEIAAADCATLEGARVALLHHMRLSRLMSEDRDRALKRMDKLEEEISRLRLMMPDILGSLHIGYAISERLIVDTQFDERRLPQWRKPIEETIAKVTAICEGR